MSTIRLIERVLVTCVVASAPAGCNRDSTAPITEGVPAPKTRTTDHVRASAVGGGSPDTPLRFQVQKLPFHYERGETGSAWPVETTGGGVAMLDFDGDGDLDLFFAQGVPLPVAGSGVAPTDVLLENQGAGRFVDVSAQVGLTFQGYGQGVTVADYDGDGDADVYVTRYGANTLWRNDAGRFTDATAEAGVGSPLWSLGAAFFDYDDDGDLDLFVANYFDFDQAAAPFGHDPRTGEPDYGMPAMFQGQPDILYRNEGGGRFRDVTAEAGVADESRGMGVLAADFDGDGRIDVFVANDAQANALWRNRGDGTFENVAESVGLAYNGEGMPEANMGIAFGDTDGDLLSDVFVTHFYDEHDTLWRALSLQGAVFFQDQTREAGLAADSRPLTGWGTAFADFDQDGHLDLVATAGHIRREPDQPYHYENPPILWHNDGRGRFVNVTHDAGPYFREGHVGRGLAVGDLDNDGDLDMVVVHHHTPSVVLWNETPRRGNALMLRLRGQGLNPDAIGARLVVTVGSRRILRTVDGGGSYLSGHDPRIHLGLGKSEAVDEIEVRWPSGLSEMRRAIPSGGVVEWNEGEDNALDSGSVPLRGRTIDDGCR